MLRRWKNESETKLNGSIQSISVRSAILATENNELLKDEKHFGKVLNLKAFEM